MSAVRGFLALAFLLALLFAWHGPALASHTPAPGASDGIWHAPVRIAAAVRLRASIAGSEVPHGSVATIRVDQDLDQPDMATIVVQGREGVRLANRLIPGAEVTIVVEPRPSAATLFKGEVVGIEPVLDAGGESRVAIRAFDRLHRLTREEKTRTFYGMTDNEIVAIITAEHGLVAGLSSAPNVRHDQVSQHNQTDLAFLRERASLLGFDVWIEDATLFFARRAPEAAIQVTPRPSAAGGFRGARALTMEPPRPGLRPGRPVGIL
jgi:hypothetical protein